jgi:hypothetical protein
MRRRRRRLPASAFIAWDRKVSVDELKIRLAERDRRQAADTRTEAQRWLGDPPMQRSALALMQNSSSLPVKVDRRKHAVRVDLWKF